MHNKLPLADKKSPDKGDHGHNFGLYFLTAEEQTTRRPIGEEPVYVVSVVSTRSRVVLSPSRQRE